MTTRSHPIPFPARVKSARKQLRLTQEGLGAKLGVTESTVNRWEAGEREPDTLTQLAKLARALGVSVDWLLGMPDAQAPPDVRVIDDRALARLSKNLLAAVREMRLLSADAPPPADDEE